MHTDRTEAWLCKLIGYSKYKFNTSKKNAQYLLELLLPGGSEGAQETAQPLNQ